MAVDNAGIGGHIASQRRVFLACAFRYRVEIIFSNALRASRQWIGLSIKSEYGLSS